MTQRIDWRGRSAIPAIKSNPSPYSAIIFPPNPSVGDQFTAPNGATYQWDGMVWFNVSTGGGGVAEVPIGSAPPLGAVTGQLWWRNDPDGTLYILYNDGTSTQWVPVLPDLGGGGGVGDAPSDGNMYVRQNGAWVQIVPGIADAPSDGNTYGRLDGAWVIIP